MRLRIRHAAGMSTLTNLTPQDTVCELKKQVASTLGVEYYQNIQVNGGYPPKTFSNENDTLQLSGIRDGDALNIVVVDTYVPPPVVSDAIDIHGHGCMVLRVMEDDNSCLFRSVGYVVNRDKETAQALRKVVADNIKADPMTYSDVTLGQPREKYIEWIQTANAWGGAIELAIFASHFGIEIDSIDVQTGRIDKFGEGKYDKRVLIVYSGIHYDALALSPMKDAPTDFDQTQFSMDEEFVLSAAKQMADVLNKQHKYTDIANFTLRCEICRTGLIGEKDAQEHAKTTGHTHFTEYN
ncbi:OTU-domain-containing protein [Backusella circina FSU 941]|nr:OTU-domain-containing protein [Backusella circina FSU 941]KAI8883496.1 OTU-domain-containing protein [Backusella circina FSU 941]